MLKQIEVNACADYCRYSLKQFSLSRYGAGNWLDMSNHTFVYDWSGQIQVVMIVYDSTPLLPDLPNEDSTPV